MNRNVWILPNAFRVAQGKPVVLYDAAAARVAYAYAKDLAERNFFDHKDPEGRGPMERMVEAGLDIHKVTENLARGYGDAILGFPGLGEFRLPSSGNAGG